MNTATRMTVLLLCLGSSAASAQSDQAVLSTLTPDAWRQPGVWYFYVLDSEQRKLGHIALLLTHDAADTESCVDKHWRKAIVMESTLDFDFGVEIAPAYFLNGPWLTVELTASSCSLNHRLIGDASDDGATGSFHYIHSLSSSIVGTFSAKPSVETD